MTLEVIATTLKQAEQAELMGADRLEIVMGIQEGGLTPSYALVKKIKERVQLPLVVMIRPHSQSFCYSSQDISVMREDIQFFRKLKVDNFVIGALDEKGNIDKSVMKELLSYVGEVPVTFHRAFDASTNYEKSLEDLKDLPQIVRLLTSFGANSELNGRERLKTLTRQAQAQGLSLLWGGGVTKDNIDVLLKEIQPDEIHLGSAVRFHMNCISDLEEERMQFFLKKLKRD